MLDLVPTITDALRLPPLPECVGRSLLPLASGTSAPPWRDAVVATFNGQQFGLYTQRAIRTKRWKYIWNATDVDELYDLEADPAELSNLIGSPEHASEIAGLRRRLYSVLIDEGDRQVDNDWVRSQLLEDRVVVE